MKSGQDRRIRRTRAALLAAFGQLAMHRRHRKIRVSDIIEAADVGRSTFYDHFSSAEHLYLEALSGPFDALADAVAGRGDRERLTGLLIHFHDNRQRVRELFDTARMREKATRLLADMVAGRLEVEDADLAIPRKLAALQLAEGALAPIRAWIAGEAPCAPEALAQSLCHSSARLVAALSTEADPRSPRSP